MPRLPFGEITSQSFADARAFGDALAGVVSGVQAFEPTRSGVGFSARVSGLLFSDMTLLAVASTPARLEVGVNDQLAFGFMTSGWMEMAIPGGGTYRGVAGETGCVASSCPRLLSGDDPIATIIITVASERLQRTARTMLGSDAAACRLPDGDELAATGAGLVPLQQASASWAGVLSSLLAGIDAVGSEPAALTMLAIDDQFVRLLVAVLRPELVMPGEGDRVPQAVTAIAVRTACDFLDAHLADPISLTQLEELTGLAARTLQVAFQKHHQCSPLEWLRRRRLDRIRQRLLMAGDERPIRTVAAECGFRQPGHFARQYAERFGERPLQTRLLYRRRR